MPAVMKKTKARRDMEADDNTELRRRKKHVAEEDEEEGDSSSSEASSSEASSPRRSQSRLGYTPPPKSGLRIRRLSSSSSSSKSLAEEDEMLDRRARDLSPSAVMEAAEQAAEHVRHYLEDVAEVAEDVMERLSELPTSVVHKTQTAAHSAADAVKATAHNAADAVKHGAHNAADAVKATAHNAADAVKHGAHNAADAVSSAVHTGEMLVLDLWKACHFEKLPEWLKDNEHLHFGHRPELQSFAECFKSIFRIHTETGNIWTHLIGCVAFVIITIVFYLKPLCATCQLDIDISEKLVFLAFFVGAIVCLGCSTLFHTLSCHSPNVSSLFSRLDYAGIALLIVGSLIPWLYYGFYCQYYARLTYMIAMTVMGALTIMVTLWEKFNLPEYRVWRASVFVALGGLGVVPIAHHFIQFGAYESVLQASVHILIISGAIYLTGAILYAARIPERFYPGKCDIWFQSHQIFHVLVILGAFVHYHGISEMAMYRLKRGDNCNSLGGEAPVIPVSSSAADIMAEKLEIGGAVF